MLAEVELHFDGVVEVHSSHDVLLLEFHRYKDVTLRSGSQSSKKNYETLALEFRENIDCFLSTMSAMIISVSSNNPLHHSVLLVPQGSTIHFIELMIDDSPKIVHLTKFRHNT